MTLYLNLDHSSNGLNLLISLSQLTVIYLYTPGTPFRMYTYNWVYENVTIV